MPSYLDLGLLCIVLLSALLAMLRGFTREFLAIVSWGVAALAAYYFYPMVLPFVKPHIAKDSIAMAVSAGAVFFLALILISILTVRASDAILDSKIGALDRTLGFVFGAGRGWLLCAVAFVFFAWLVPEKTQPDWVKNAKMKPLLAATGGKIMDMLPDDADTIIARFKKPKGAQPEDTPAEGDATPQPPARPGAGAPAAPKKN
ncbi:MAG: CvpA family protein [Hyphomicrobiales bacterium]|nr:CvpA family protein [Hyphomicrobiales bacterium]